MSKFQFILIFFIVFIGHLKAQDEEIYSLFLKFEKLYKIGDLINAEKCMLLVRDSKVPVHPEYLVSMNINLGVVSNLLGRYKESLEYNSQAESLVHVNKISHKILADIYSNKARTYNLQKLFPNSIEYLEKAIRIYLGMARRDRDVLISLSAAYQNIAISYQGLEDFGKSLMYLEKSAELKSAYSLSGKALTYLSIANIHVKTSDSARAELFFIFIIDEFVGEFGETYFRIADVYFDYGLFLRSSGKDNEALECHKRALEISLQNFGKKHPNVSLAYKHIGDYYYYKSDYNSALQFLQKAMIAQLSTFDNSDIYINPPIDSLTMDVDFLKILQRKSEALNSLSLQQKNLQLRQQILIKSQETIELALQLINMFRIDYLSEVSRLYLAENGKETYILAARISNDLYILTKDPHYLQKMYAIARQAKSALLMDEVTNNELIYSKYIPDTLKQKYKRIQGDIAAYNNLVHEVLKNPDSDEKKIDFWKDALFEMNREKERIKINIDKQLARYQNLMKKAEPISLERIQKSLKKDETLIEYLISNKYNAGKRKLYIFTVTRDNLYCQESLEDSVFEFNVRVIRDIAMQLQSDSDQKLYYRNYSVSLFNMYDRLIKPIEKNISGKKLIIIPDEEIAYLPFDAFIKKKPKLDQIDYEGLQYLIKDYIFSYGYTSSMIFNNYKNIKKLEIYSFSPVYKESGNSAEKFDFLSGTGKEIKSIYKLFKGDQYLGEKATESNFKALFNIPVIFHLAMHSISDTIDSRYSFLIFDSHCDSTDDGNLYDYEIGLSRIKSPMVVLSACNTGAGMLYLGEGVMSITRAFILAGASSVIKTLWDVNDDVSATIISSFYKYLSEGKEKDESLRLAKLDYLESSNPAYTSPYYWAAYQVVGDKSSIVIGNKAKLFIIPLLAITLVFAGLVYYKRRRRALL